MHRNIDIKTFGELTALIYRAALEPAKWQDFVDALARATGGRAHMFGYDARAGIALGGLWAGYDPADIASFNEHYSSISPRAQGHSQLKPGSVSRAGQLISDEAYMKTEFYQDWIRPQEDIMGGSGGLILKDWDRMFIMGTNLRAKDRDRLEIDGIELNTLLMPHLQQAFAISRAVSARTFHNDHPMAPSTVVMMVDSAGHLLDGDPGLHRLVGSLLRFHSNGWLGFTRSDADELLGRCLLDVKQGLPVSKIFPCGRDAAGLPYLCRAVRYVPDEHAGLTFRLGLADSEPCLLLTITPQAANQNMARELASRFHLTQAEIAIAKAVADGLRPAQIADERGVSLHTIRGQLKVVMQKTGTSRQSDLVRLFVSGLNG